MLRTGPLWLSIFALLIAGGCPQATDPALDSSTTENDVRPVGDASDIQGVQATRDALSEQYAGCEEPSDGDALRAKILELVNQTRVENGLGEVELNSTLEAEANEYACEMIFYDFFAHENPVTGSTLRTRAEEVGYDFSVIGENLAAGQLTPEQAFNDWMESPGHRANILDERFTELGIGVRRGGSYGWYWVQEFGRPTVVDAPVGPLDPASVLNGIRR